jgi:hypothetical protein
MQARHLQKIYDIDERIKDMHCELTELYAERAGILDPAYNSSIPNFAKPAAGWALQKYNSLRTAWDIYGISIPAYNSLQPKLLNAHKIILEMTAYMPELSNKLDILVVPPGNTLPFPAPAELRGLQEFSLGQDYVDPDFRIPAGNRKWRILVVYDENVALPMGIPTDILATKSYVIGGYDSRALGPMEYSALTLQCKYPIDDGAWTLLLKNHKPNESVLSATFADGRYRFDSDDAGTGLDIDYFRPAVEVK